MTTLFYPNHTNNVRWGKTHKESDSHAGCNNADSLAIPANTACDTLQQEQYMLLFKKITKIRYFEKAQAQLTLMLV